MQRVSTPPSSSPLRAHRNVDRRRERHPTKRVRHDERRLCLSESNQIAKTIGLDFHLTGAHPQTLLEEHKIEPGLALFAHLIGISVAPPEEEKT